MSVYQSNPLAQYSISNSAFASGTKTFMITLEEGVVTPIRRDFMVDTARYSHMGVATRLTLLSYTEQPGADTEMDDRRGISFIRTSTTQSGNNASIPLISDRLLQSSEAGGPPGVNSVLVASAGSGEPISLIYDPSTFGFESVNSGSPTGWSAVYIVSPTVAGLGDLDLAWTDAAARADVAFAQCADTDVFVASFRICARTDSAIYHVLNAAYATSSGEGRLEALVQGGRRPVLHFDSTAAVAGRVDFVIRGAGLTPSSDILCPWTAFTVTGVEGVGVQGFLQILFGSLTPVSGVSNATHSPLSAFIGTRSAPARKRVCRALFSAEAVYGDEGGSSYNSGVMGR